MKHAESYSRFLNQPLLSSLVRKGISNCFPIWLASPIKFLFSTNNEYKSTEAERQAVHKYALKETHQEQMGGWLPCSELSQHFKRLEHECYMNSILGSSLNGVASGRTGHSWKPSCGDRGDHMDNMVSLPAQSIASTVRTGGRRKLLESPICFHLFNVS